MPDDIKIIILAAGIGKRMKSDLPKVLILLKGKPFLWYVATVIKKSGVCQRPAVVIGKGAELIKKALGPGYDYVYQAEQLGTGHAVSCAKDLLQKSAENVMILYGDHPFIKPDTIKNLARCHIQERNILTMATVKVHDFLDWRSSFYQFGRVIRGSAEDIIKIIELKDSNEQEKNITEVNPSYFCFQAQWLWENISKLKNENAQKEYYLTDLVEMAVEQKQKVGSLQVDPKEAVGINTPEQLLLAEKLL